MREKKFKIRTACLDRIVLQVGIGYFRSAGSKNAAFVQVFTFLRLTRDSEGVEVAISTLLVFVSLQSVYPRTFPIP